jgi:hypothetical protein
MKFLQVLVDNSAAVLAWLTSLFAVLLLLDVIDLSQDQIAGIVAFVGATIGLLSLFLTVAKRQVLALVPNGGPPVAGPAARETTGSEVYTATDADGRMVAMTTLPDAA